MTFDITADHVRLLGQEKFFRCIETFEKETTGQVKVLKCYHLFRISFLCLRAEWLASIINFLLSDINEFFFLFKEKCLIS